MRRLALVAVCLLLSTRSTWAAEASQRSAATVKAAADLCDPATGNQAEVAKLLGLAPGIVEADTTCRILQENVWADNLPDYVFNFITPTDNGSRFQTVIIYSAEGERVGLYHAQNFPLELDIVERKRGLPSYIHLEGHGRWMEQELSWAGTFRLEGGRFVPVPDKNGVPPPAPRCPTQQVLDASSQNGVHRRDLRAAICPDEACLLDCVDSDTSQCVHNVGAYWVGSFSAPNVLEVLLEMKPAGQLHKSVLYLLKATPCGWKRVTEETPTFAAIQDACSQVLVGKQDVIVCKQRAVPGADGGLVLYAVRNGSLTATSPFHLHVTPDCQAKELLTSNVTDVSFDDPDDEGTIRVDTLVDAAQIKWSNRGAHAETCSAASQRLAATIKTHRLQLDLTRDGLRMSSDELDQLRADPVPGLVAK